nr:hypothetical protein BaRGS_015884 [Batillaria attramentaria]
MVEVLFVDFGNTDFVSKDNVTGREVTVYFLDYGNTETVSAGNIRELKEEFRALPAQAVKCSLSGVASPSGNWTDDAAAAFEDMVLEKEYVANVISKEPNGSHVVSLVECGENTDVATSLINNHPDVIKGSAKAASVSPRPSAGGASLPSFSPLPVRVPSRCQVFVSWVTTPGDFYVQLADNHSILDSLTDDLQSFYNGPKASPVASVQLGMMVVAKFSEDKAWYRGVVRGISGNTADVQFVDFGNSEKVQFDSLKQIDRQFCNIPAQAGCCSLSGVRPLTQGQTWSGDAKDFLETLTGDGAMCHFLVKKGDVLEVELEVGGKSIAKEMVAHAVVRGASEPPSDGGSRFQQYRFEKLQTGQRAEVYVAFAESVVSFYVQLADRMQELDELMAELETHYNSGVGKPLLNPQVGMPCAARYNEDGLWYRARVKAFTAKDVDVFFVDYGNTQVANKDAVYQMEPAFMSLAAQAIQCSLDVREGRGADAQLTHFNQFTGDAKLELVVKGQDGSKLLVDLLKNGLSLTTEIKGGSPAQSPPKTVKPGEYTPAAVAPGQTVQAFASFIESTSKFWIQLAGCDGDLDAIMKHLSQQYESGVQPALATPTPGQACCALYAEDQLWYRASVLSIHGQQIKVRFVDYGNAELVDRENVKPISPDILSKPVMAIECCLEGFQSASMTDAALEATETLLAEKEITVTFTGGKNVRVTVDGADAGKVLSDKGFGGQQQTTLPSPKSPPAQSGFGSRSPQSAGKAGGGFGARSPPAPVLGSQTLKDPSPPSGSSDAIITHLEDDNGMFFVQLLSAETQLEQLSSKLQSVFSSGGLPLSGPPTKDMVCCARFSVDGCWYRSKIESISGGKAKVRFVDYGNAEVVQVNGLKAVPADLLTVPVQAFPCRLKGLPAWTKQTALAFSRAALDVQVKVRFVSSSSPFHVQISVKGQDLLQLLSRSPASSPQKPFGAASQDRPRGSPPSQGFGGKQDAQSSRPSPQSFGGAARHGGFGSPQKFGSPPQKPSFPQQVYQAQKPPTGKQNAYVSHVSDDGTFYLQLSHEAEKIEEITGKLQSLASSVHPDPVVGAACTAKFSEDGAWYRAVIKATSGASADVLFVDFGNGEKSAISSLRPLPADLLIPATAYHCQLEETGPLAPEQLEMFNTATEDKQLTAAFSPGNPMSVTLWDENGKNLVETLFPLGTLKPQKVPQETAPALVSHVCDNGLFYVHLNREENELLALHENLHRSYAGQVEKLESFGEGQICCAKFSEDEAWYRAVVLKDLNDSASVLFVDYGNTDIVNKDNILKLLPGLNQPPFAYECRLQGVVKWTEDQKKKFVAMTEGKRMNVRFLSSKAPYTVELTRSIELDLIEENAPQNGTAAVSGEEKSEKAAAESAPRFNGEASSAELATFPSQTPPGTGLGIVSHVDGEGIFFLQLHSEDETRETLSERLQEECESAESVKPVLNMACCAKYSEDEAWYRAVVEKVEAQAAIVRFIDFGNTDHVPFSDLKNVSAESLSVAPLAYCCFLEGCESVQDLVTEKLEEYTADQTLTVTFTSPAKLPPHSVRLQLEDGSNVATLLLSSNNNTAAEGNLVEETEAASGVKNEGLGTGSEVKLEGSERKSSTLMVGRQKVTVGHMVSPSLFYVQREDQQSEVDKQLDAMFEHYSSLAEGDGLVEHPTVGQLCASQFGEDGSWYRACIRSVDKETDTLTLFYVDYGNTEMVPASSVRLLLPEFETLPWQAVACSLAGVRCQGDEWTEEVKAAFSELIAEKSVLADVIAGSGEDGAYVVNLLDLGISVASSLLERGLPGIEAVEVESSVKHIFDDTTVGESLLSDSEDKFEDTVQDASEDGGARAGQSEKRTVDELEDNENEVEFSRQLNQRAAQLESTMLDEPADGKVSPQEQDTTGVAEENATKDNEDKVEEDEDDFQDAMETGGAKGEEKVNKQADDDHQLKFSCVAEGLAELEWIDVRVCSARSAEEFWCQLPSAQDDLVRIESDANSTAGPEKVQNVQIGHVYLVCDPQATIYRAKVLTADEGVESVSVLKVDHGEVETVTKTCLFHLTNDQLSVPAQAFACCLDDGVQPKHAWFLDLVSRGEMCDREFQLKVVGRKTDGTLLVDLREAPSGEDSSQLVKDTTEIREKEAGGEENEEGKKKAVGEMSMNQTLEFSQPILQSTVLGETMWQSRIDKSDAEREFSVQYLEVNKEYEALATARGVPDAFYLSLTSAQGMLNALADDIAAEVAEKPDDVGLTESAAVGSPCLVQDKTSSSWLRGQVKSVAGELCKVLCVDSGACVEARKADLRELPSRFLDTPVQAVLCSLADLVPVDGQWCDDALTFFTDFLSQGTLRVYVCGYSADGSVCRVTVLEQQTQSNNTTAFSRTGNEPSLNRTLVELGYAEAVAGSALDVELQLERTINDPDKLEQFESSFTEVSCQRENSISDVSGEDEEAEGTLTPVEVSPNECSEREEDDSGDDKLVTALELEAMTVQMESMAVLEADQREADDAEELLEQMAELIDQYGNIINPLGDMQCLFIDAVFVVL